MVKTTFQTLTLGCRVNQAETKKISQDLLKLGFYPYQKNDYSQPDLIIVNTCVVTRKGEQESAKTIRRLRKNYPGSLLVATGCAANLWLKVCAKSKNQLPPADIFITNEQKYTLAKTISRSFLLSLANPSSSKEETRSLVKIQDGCDHFCSYCIVPHLRPEPTSKSLTKTVKEINHLVKNGTREVILCGINLSLYGRDLNPKISLNQLIKTILKKTTISRLSLSSLTPRLVNQELVDIFLADYQKDRRLSTYLHLALQSGSPTTLKRMNRKTNLKKLKTILRYLKEIIPDFNLRADIMVGFPGETEKEFQQTINFIKKTKIAFIHLFRYSLRPGTIAQKMIDTKKWQKVDHSVKKDRWQKIAQITKQIRKKEAQSIIGKTKEVLILKKTNLGWWGISDNYWPTNINNVKNSNLKQKNILGKIVPVKITSQSGNQLRGNLVLTNQAS